MCEDEMPECGVIFDRALNEMSRRFSKGAPWRDTERLYRPRYRKRRYRKQSRMDPLVKAAASSLERNSLLRPGLPIVAAVSGGPDSVALLLALAELRPNWSLDLSAAHVNYGLRGLESDEDESFVRNLCARLSIPLEVRNLDSSMTRLDQGNLQDRARRIRYSFFFEVAGRRKAVVATGHTLEDQAETFLMKLIRGSGLTGLSGIFAVWENPRSDSGTEPTTVVRPLLEVGRGEILDYLSRRHQPFRADLSNQDLAFERNWIRQQLIPLLLERLNPRLPQTLGRTAQLFQEVGEFLKSEGEKAFDRCRIQNEEQSRAIGLRVEILNQGDLLEIGQSHVDEVLALCSKQSGREVHLPGNILVSREFDHLRFGERKKVQPFNYELPIPGEIYIPEIRKRVVLRSPRPEVKESGEIMRLRGNSVRVRSRLPGDRYQLPGESVRKLKEILIEGRIPKNVRDSLVLIEADDRLAWVEGFPANQPRGQQPAPQNSYEVGVYDETLEEVSPLTMRRLP